MMKKIMYGLSLAMAIVLAACSQPAKPTKRSSESSSSAAQTVSSTSAEKEQVQSIDGSYRGQDAESTILLVVTGQKGTYTVTDSDGEEETKEVAIDPVNQSMRIGDELYRY